ncbi:MAG: NAD-binding protein, partial [Coriobacteriia bacterium]|nr:NAD-binding protein [Coriobacteriia bacterium]
AVHDHSYLDAGIVGAKSTLQDKRAIVFAAGEAKAFVQAKTALDLLSEQVHYVGEAGAGIATRLSWQISVAGGLVAIVEALAFARAYNVDKFTTLNLFESDAHESASVARHFGKSVIEEAFHAEESARDYLRDLSVALDAADEASLPLPGLESVHRLFSLLQMVSSDDLSVVGLALVYYDEKNSERFGIDWSQIHEALDDHDWDESDDQLDYYE